MSESPTQPPTADTNPPAPKKKKRRLWLRLLLGVFAFLILLVLLAPTIASLGFVRKLVLGKVNEFVNGKVDISDWSIGWTSGVHATGVRIEDEKGEVIFDGQASTQLSLLNAVRGNLDLGETALKGTFLVQIDENGKTNLEKFLKPSESTPSTEPVSLPDLKGKVIVDLKGKVEQAKGPTVFVNAVKLDTTITDVNQPLTPSAVIEMKVGEEGQTGTIKLDGTVDAFDKNELALQKLAADLKLNIANIDLSAANPFLASAQAILHGVANGSLNIKTEGISKPFAEGQITVTGLSAGGEVLKGDTLDLGTLSIPLKVTANVADDGATVIKIDKFRAEIPQGFIDVAGQVTQKSIDRLMQNQSPGDDGWVSLTVALNDIPGLIKQLPHTLPMQEGVTVTAGKFSKVTNITLRKDDIVSKSHIDLQASGTNGDQPIEIAPVSVSFDATYLPGADPLKGLRDMALVVNSQFATISGGGASLGKLDLNGSFDLAKLRAQAAQFVDLKDLQFDGSGNFKLTSNGDVQKPGDIVKTTAAVTLNSLNLAVPKIPALKFEKLVLDSSADLSPGTSSLIAAVRRAAVNFQTFDAGQPIVDLAGTANGVDLDTLSVQRFELAKLTITDLAKVQTMLDGFLPQSLKDKGFRITEGQIYSNVVGSYDGKTGTIVLEKPFELSTPNLSIVANDAKGNSVPLISKEKFSVSLQAQATLAKDGSIKGTISRLGVNSSSKLLTIGKDEGDFAFHQAANGAFSGKGSINIAANLKPLNDVAQVFTGRIEGAGDLTSGMLAATIALKKADKPESLLNVNGDITQLSITTADPKAPIQNEAIHFELAAVSPDDLSGIRDLNASLKGSWLAAALTNGQLSLKGGIWEMVQNLDVAVSSSDLSRVQQVVNAFAGAQIAQVQATKTKGKKAKTAEPAPDAPAPPLMVRSGELDLKASIVRDANAHVTRINVPAANVRNLALKRGEANYAFDPAKPVSIKLVAEVNAIDDEKKSVTEQIQSIKVAELSGDLQVATLAMPQPIVVTNLASSPAANGTVTVTTDIAKVTPLLAVLQGGEELPYAGALAFTQNLASDGDNVKVLGNLTIDNFKVLDSTDRTKAAFVEKQIAVRNDLSANLRTSTAKINTLTIDMPESKAVGVVVTGAISDWVVKRELQNVKLDLSYDLEKIWPIVKPMLSPETQETLKDLKVVGKYTKPFTLRGSLPAKNAKGEELAFNQSVKNLNGEGGLSVDLLDAAGLKIEKLDVPVLIEEGKVAILTPDKKRPSPATCNGGTLDLGEITIDLTADEPRAWTAKNQKLLHNVTINPLLGDTLGKYVNPVFANSKRAAGLLDVTIEYCRGVGIISKWQTPESGSARIVFSLTDMDIANPLGGMMLGKLSSAVAAFGDVSKGQSDTFKGQIKDAVVTLDKGRTKQDVTLSLTATEPAATATGTPKSVTLPLGFRGDINLQNLQQNLQVSLPVGLLVGVGKETDIRKALHTAFPSGIPLTLTGTTTAPQVDIGNFFQRFAEGQLKSRISGGGGGGLGDILGQLGGNKDKKDDSSADKSKKKKK
jgi:hypothetical protein